MGRHGKDPHRPQGKKGADENDDRHFRALSPPPSYKNARDEDLELLRRQRQPAQNYEPGQSGEDVQVGGSRPNVESRVKEAIDRREEREAQEEEGA